MGFMNSCPGSKIFKSPMPEPIECSGCGKELEIWTDELRVVCKDCGRATYRDRMPACIDWCRHAEDCVGPELLRRLSGM